MAHNSRCSLVTRLLHHHTCYCITTDQVLHLCPQFANLTVILCQVLYHYMPPNGGLWIMFGLILWEGLLGGTAYVNTFFRITQEVCYNICLHPTLTSNTAAYNLKSNTLLSTCTQFQVEEEYREYSMGVASVGDSTGVVISAFLSIAAHNGLCHMRIAWGAM